MKKLLAILMVAALVFAFAACTPAAPATEEPAEGGEETSELARVAFICKGYSDTYCYLVYTIFDEYAKSTYADLFTVDSFDGEINNDVINNLLETCVADNYDVIILQQNDPDSPVPIIKDAVSKGINVVVTVGSVNDDGESYYLDADPVQQGSLLTTYAIEQGIVKEGTNVAVLRGIDGTFHADGRHEGYINDLTAVKANIVDDQTANWATSEAQPIVEAWLVSNPEIEVIFAANDDMALGAINAMELADRTDIKVFSVDANEQGCINLKKGLLTCSVAQDTFGYAEGAADYAAKLIKGEAVESVRLDSSLVLPERADEILMTVHGYSQADVDALNEELGIAA